MNILSVLRAKRAGAIRAVRGSFFRRVAGLSGATATAQVITLAVTPIITRIYSPAELGILTVFLSVYAFAVPVAAGRLDLLLPVAEDHRHAAGLFRAALVLLVAVTGVAALAIMLPAARTLMGFGVTQAAMLTLAIPIGGLQVLATGTALRDGQYRLLGKKTVFRAGTKSGVQLCAGLAGLTGHGLLMGEVLGNGAGTLALLGRSDAARAALRPFEDGLYSVRSILLRHRAYIVQGVVGVLFTVGALQIPVPMLGSLYGLEFVGFFGLAYRITALPVGLTAAAISQVYRGHLSLDIRTAASGLSKRYLKVTTALAIAGALPAILLALFGPSVVAALFGRQWLMSGTLIRLLVPMVFLKLVFAPTSESLSALGRERWHLVWAVARFFAVVACLGGLARTGADGLSTVAAYSAVMSGGYLAHGTITFRALRSHEGRAGH